MTDVGHSVFGGSLSMKRHHEHQDDDDEEEDRRGKRARVRGGNDGGTPAAGDM